jgi:hypothetical protein
VLGGYLANCMADAIRDLPDQPVDALYRRFIGWIRWTA